AAVERTPAQAPRTGDDDAVRVAEKEIRAHAAQLLEREQTQLVHPVVHERLTARGRCENGDQADHVARESRPQPRREATRSFRMRSIYPERLAVNRALDVHARQDCG